jgi:hypothetical protein
MSDSQEKSLTIRINFGDSAALVNLRLAAPSLHLIVFSPPNKDRHIILVPMAKTVVTLSVVAAVT